MERYKPFFSPPKTADVGEFSSAFSQAFNTSTNLHPFDAATENKLIETIIENKFVSEQSENTKKFYEKYVDHLIWRFEAVKSNMKFMKRITSFVSLVSLLITGFGIFMSFKQFTLLETIIKEKPELLKDFINSQQSKIEIIDSIQLSSNISGIIILFLALFFFFLFIKHLSKFFEKEPIFINYLKEDDEKNKKDSDK